jgi:glycosyltransferase involved in cell wall biosynthesis
MLTEPKFSIITPVHVYNKDRGDQLLRAIKSVENQTYKNFEHIIINDGSTMAVDIPHHPWLRTLNQEHLERIIAFNYGFAEARGDWFCVLDSDDEWAPDYLEQCVSFIKEWPEYRMFNFGCKYLHKDGKVTERDAFQPAELEVGHEVFGTGNIVSGTYIWSRDIYADLGGFPPAEITEGIDVPWYRKGSLSMCSPWDFSAYFQWKHPEIQPLFQVVHPDHPAGLPKELGNPWGQDYALFYEYTRKYKSKAILGKFLYLVHPK